MVTAQPVNYKDLLFKVFWTAIAVALATLSVELADVDAWFIPPVTGGINYALAWIRQFIGVTSPSLPPVGGRMRK